MTYYSPTTYYYSGCKCSDASAASISGRMSLDADRDNSERSAGGGWDAGVGGKKVYLIDSLGRVVASTTTADDGSYKFAQLKAGSYQVSFEATEGHSFALKDIGDNRFDSDVSAAGKTDWIKLASCQNLGDVDASIQRNVGKIVGSVFLDTQCDGINGTVKVVPGCDYVIQAEDMCKSGSLVNALGTQASGGKFVKLQCGTTGTLSENFNGKSGVYDVVIRVQDENDGRSTIQLKVNGVLVNAVRLDLDTDGAGGDNGGFSNFVIKNVTINTGNSIQLAVTGDGGEYVRLDMITLQGHSTTVVTPEPPKANVKILLLDSTDHVVATTYTDVNGNYKFDNVVPGQYKIMGVAPDGTHFTLKDIGTNDAIDSDVGSDGTSGGFSVVSGGTTDIDLGVCEITEGSLSGRYFYDADCDDLDNNGDTGIGGKTVTLLLADGVTVVATTITAANGAYAFSNVEAGTYIVQFQNSAAEHRHFVGGNAGGDDAIDSDVTNSTAGTTDTVTVTANVETTDVDAGVCDEPGALSGRYFFDADDSNTDNGDVGVEGKTVTLFKADGTTLVGTTTTDANGNYSFTGLIPGSYIVQFQSSTAEGRQFDLADQGADDTIDSDADGITGRTNAVTVLAGVETKDVDVGVYVPNKAPIAIDDAGMTCADETLSLNLLDGDSDPDIDPIAVVSISDSDETVGVGGTIHLASGALVTLNGDGTITYDGIAAHSTLTIGQQAVDGFSYTISDGDLTATANAGVTVCGALNTPESIDERVFDGATANFTLNAFTLANSINAFTITLNAINIPDDFNSPKLTIANLGGPAFISAYCLDYTQDITTRVLTNSNLMVATEANALVAGLTVTAADHMDSVNWLLNQHFTAMNNGDGDGKTYTDLEVQEAIYIMLNGDTFFINNTVDFGNAFLDNNNGIRDGAEKATAQNAHEIANLALANGDGFLASYGDILGLILDPTAPAGQEQPFIIGVQFDLFTENCLCA